MQLLNTEERVGSMEFISLYRSQHGMHSITNGLHSMFNIPRARLWGAVSGIEHYKGRTDARNNVVLYMSDWFIVKWENEWMHA
jgi:hypothetical protein